jgi:hypothetical protein
VDIGAKVGDYATQALELWPGSTVAAIEPPPQCFARLQRRVAGRISLVQFECNAMNVISWTFLRVFAELLPGIGSTACRRMAWRSPHMAGDEQTAGTRLPVSKGEEDREGEQRQAAEWERGQDTEGVGRQKEIQGHSGADAEGRGEHDEH